MRAAGAYLRIMREHLGISQAEVSRRIKASPSQVHRIEEGPGETRATLVAAMAVAVDADPEDVIRILADERITEEKGIELARVRIRSRSNGDVIAPVIHPEVIDLAAQMTEFQLGKWVALGERIIKGE